MMIPWSVGAVAGLALGGLAPAQDGAWSAERVIGESRSGRAIRIAALGMPGDDELGRTRDERPALLIVAGIDGRHAVGTLTAEAVRSRLVTDHRDLLETHTVYVVSALNPDGLAAVSRRNGAPVDADHDARVGEDGGDDLNGDGLVTMMRVKNPPPEYGLDTGRVADAGEPRLMREAEAGEGEVGEYAVLVEGLDNDGDGALNEDGPRGAGGGGVDLDMNFPSFFPEHADGAGAYPLSEPETRAIVEWMLERDNIVAVLVYGPNDNLLNTPNTKGRDESGRMPKGIEEDDEAYHKKIGEVFAEITSMKEAPTRDTGGSLATYAYSDFGVWSFSTPVWVPPFQMKKDKDGGDSDGEDESGGAGEEPAEPNEAGALREQGVPENLIRFLTGDSDVRAAMMAEYEQMSPEDQQREMATLAELPEAVRDRVLAIAQGQPDPGMAEPDDAGDDGAEGESAETKREEPKADKDELAWLEYSDESRDGAGFVEWVEVQHPQLGTVEVGGFTPGFRMNPPEGEAEGVLAAQTEFVAALLGRLPRLEVGTPRVERVAAGMWRVRIRATNTGYLPTRSAMGVRARRIPPEVIWLEVEPERIVSGQRVVRLWSIPGSGGHEDAEWMISGEDGETVEIRTRSRVFGDRVQRVTLGEED